MHPTSVVSLDAELGDGVRIGPFCVVHPGVVVGDGCIVDSHCVLGAPTSSFYEAPAAYEPPACRVEAGSLIRSHTVVYAGAEIGEQFECGHHVTIRERTRIGTGVRVGTRSDVQGDVTVGDFCRLHSNVFVAKHSTIEDFVWLLPNVTLANDPHPPSDTCTRGPTIRRYAVVSANAMVFPGVEIGEGALVGAMALVRHDIPARSVAVGAPAQIVGSTADVRCRDGRLGRVYPWWTHFRRGYPDGVLPPADAGLD
ncbi:MAG: acyltransferase [Gaiellaceae bacterium]|nr:MAG: acyltransferase [Gaiellaceae bacterium]